MSTPIATTQLDDENPWPGLEAFEENARAFFRGRDREAETLAKRVLDAPVTVLYGRSGLGKTSLLRAGLFPLLREHNFLPIYVRFDVKPDAAPLATQLRASISKAISDELPDAMLPDEHESVWEYLHRNDFELWNAWNYPLTPVLVLDQFEELFTLGERVPELVRNFRDDLGDLAENRIPADLADRIDADDSLTARFNLRSQNYKILVSLREDFLADLEGWRRLIPSLARSRMRLRRLQASEAFDAVYTPANTPSAQRMTTELAHRVVSIIAGEDVRRSDDKPQEDSAGNGRHDDAEVEPALLSLFCRELNEERKRRGQAIFDAQLVEDAKTDILSNYYLSCVRDLSPRVADFIESELITEKGFRNSFPRDDAVPAHLTDDELTGLIRLRLLRLEDRYGTQRIELTHDVLTGVIREQRDRRRAEEEKEALAAQAEKERQALAQAAAEREAELEKEKERQQAELEAAQKLAAAETEAKEEARELAELATKAKEEAQAHEAQLAQRTRVLRIAVAVSTIAALVAAGLWGYGWHQRRIAEHRYLEAMSLQLSAQAQSRNARERPGGEFRVIQESLAARALAAKANNSPAALRTADNGIFNTALTETDLVKIFQVPEADLVRFSGDRQHVIAFSTASCWVQSWDTTTARPIGPRISFRDGGSCYFTDFAETADAKQIWTTTREDQTLQRWDATSGQPIGSVIRTGQDISTVMYNERDGQLYTGGYDGRVRIWEASDGQLKATIRHGPEPVGLIGVSGDGRRLFTASLQGAIRFWDTKTRKTVGASIVNSEPDLSWNDVALSYDGRTVVTGRGRFMQVWDADTGECRKTDEGCMISQFDESSDGSHPPVFAVAVSRYGQSVLGGSEIGTVQRWGLADGGRLGLQVATDGRPVYFAGFLSDDGERFFASTTDGMMRVLQSGRDRWLNTRTAGSIVQTAISNDGRRIATSHFSEREQKTRIEVRDIASGDFVSGSTEVAGQVEAVAFSPDGSRLASGADDGAIRIWDIQQAVKNIYQTGPLRTLGPPMDAQTAVTALAFSPEGDQIVSGGQDGSVATWDIQKDVNRPLKRSAQLHSRAVTDVVYSPKGMEIISASMDGTVQISNAETLEPRGDPINAAAEQSGVLSVAVSPDGTLIATGEGHGRGFSDDTGVVRLWKSDTKEKVGDEPISQHSRGVTSLAFSVNGQWLVSGSEDGTVRVWSVADAKQVGDPITTYQGSTALGVAFTPVRQRLIVATKGGAIQVRESLDDQADQLCKKLYANMSDQQWREWISPDIPYDVEPCEGLPKLPDGGSN